MKIVAVLILAIAGVGGWFLQSPPYRLHGNGQPADQSALAHRDSAYASSTWVASPSDNYLQLRFFDRIEGGVCLRPSWNDICELAQQDPRLQHLVPRGQMPQPMPAEKTWTAGELPNPGTLTTNRYLTIFPAGVLLNDQLMRAAGGDPRTVAPSICIVGLGSGSGIACLLHHFPKAMITVVDIDRVVIELVRDHFPLLRWFEQEGRLKLVVRDARQYIRSESHQGTRWDLIVLDAYTSGSTIPPHLMTREFYAECASALNEGGIVMSNIIGSYESSPNGRSTKHLLLGGAIRSMVAGGLRHTHNIHILQRADPALFKRSEITNNMVVASKTPIGPRSAPASWDRLKAFVLYPELKTASQGNRRFTSSSLALVKDNAFASATVAFAPVEAVAPGLRASFKPFANDFSVQTASPDRGVVDQAIRAVRQVYAGKALPKGWDTTASDHIVLLTEIDWVEHARKEWISAILFAGDTAQHSAEALVGVGDDRAGAIIPDAPLFTDSRPNADIYNGG